MVGILPRRWLAIPLYPARWYPEGHHQGAGLPLCCGRMRPWEGMHHHKYRRNPRSRRRVHVVAGLLGGYHVPVLYSYASPCFAQIGFGASLLKAMGLGASPYPALLLKMSCSSSLMYLHYVSPSNRRIGLLEVTHRFPRSMVVPRHGLSYDRSSCLRVGRCQSPTYRQHLH